MQIFLTISATILPDGKFRPRLEFKEVGDIIEFYRSDVKETFDTEKEAIDYGRSIATVKAVEKYGMDAEKVQIEKK